MSGLLSPPPTFSYVVDVQRSGARGDGVTDDHAALTSAIASAIALRSQVRFGPGNYKVSKYIDIADAIDLSIFGDGATVVYPSDDPTVLADGIAINNNQARTAFLFRRCRNLSVYGVRSQGGTHPSFDLVNVGGMFHQTKCIGTRITNCTAYDGSSFHTQDATPDSTGTGSLSAVGSVVTLTTLTPMFYSSHPGLTVTITLASDKRSMGTFPIASYVSPTQITFANVNGIADAAVSWTIDDSDRDTIIDACKIHRCRAPITLPSHSKIINSTLRHPLTHDLGGIVGAFTISGTTVTLTATNGTWDATVGGGARYIKIAGSTSAANDGVFLILTATKRSRFAPATLTYTNGLGVAEIGSSTGTWWIPGGEKVGVAVSIAASGGTSLITVDTPSLSPSDIGKVFRQTGATSAGNNGARVIVSTPTAYTCTVSNGTGVTEACTGLWSLDGWDAGGPAGAAFGTTAMIYIYAGSDINRGRENIEIASNTFIGCRKYPVKVSGSGTPIRSISVHHNTAIECGGFFAGGADDSQEHALLNISNNIIVDCATGRSGWNESAGIFLLGCRGATVDHNMFLDTRPSISMLDGRGVVTGQFGIQVTRYSRGVSQPVVDFSATGTRFVIDTQSTRHGLTRAFGLVAQDVGQVAYYRTGGTLIIGSGIMTLSDTSAAFSQDLVGASIELFGAPDAANNVTATVLSVTGTGNLTFANPAGVGLGVAAGTYRIKPVAAKRGSYCVIRDTYNDGGATVTVQISNCVGPDVSGTVWNNAAGVQEAGSVSPRMWNGRQHSRTGSAAGIQVGATTSWPIIYDNVITANGNALNTGQIMGDVGIGVGNFTQVDYPLRGRSGRCKPTGGRPEMVVAFGSLYVEGDHFRISGITCTYKAASPNNGTGGSFSTQAGLCTLLTVGSLVAEDYGVGLTGTPTTGHIRVRTLNPSATPNALYVDTISVLNPTAFVLPRNTSAGGEVILYAQGQATSLTPLLADKTVVWTPLAALAGSPRLRGYNAAGAELITGGRATGTITCVAKASLLDSDNFTVGDGINAPVVYTYDVAGDGGSIDVSTDTTRVQVAARTAAAINATQRSLTAAVGLVAGTDDHIVTVTHNWPGAGGNITITENVANAGFVVAGMLGGMMGYYEIKTPNNAGACSVFQHGPQNQLAELCWEVN